MGAARGRPGGAPPAWVWGVRGRALSHPVLPALWAGCRGPLPTGCGCGGVRAWGPVTNPTASALACWLCALWGRHEGVRGGRPLPGCAASGVGRSPTPDCPPFGRAAGAHYPLAVGAGGCGRGDPSPTPQRALLRAGFARCGGGMRAPGGGASCLGLGRPGSGALPPPTARPLGGLLGPGTHWLWVPWGAGVGTRHQPHSARSCVLALRAVGAARGRRGGAPPAWVWGVRGRALSHPRLPALWAGCRGPLPTGCGCGGVRAWGPVTNPTARALASWLCALWGRHEGARGGRLLPGCGASGVGRSPTPTARPLGGLLGPTTHWLWVRGGAGVGTRHQPHSARSCVLWGRHEGARGGHLLPGCGASRVGRSPIPDCPPSGRAAGAHYPLAVGAGGCGCAARVCVCLPCLAGSGGPASRARFGAPHPSFGRSWFAPCLSGPLRAGVALFVVVVEFFCFFSPSLPRCSPVVSCFACFPAPGALGLGVLSPPLFFLFPPPHLSAPLSPVLCVFRPGVPLALASCFPPLFFLCTAVWCCAVVPCRFFLFFCLLVALVSCCSPLLLDSGPVPGRFCFCALPVRCCAGVPASLLSVRCSLALAGLAGVWCCCLLCLCVCCWAWLSSVVSWWVLVAPGVVSRWRAVVCPWVLCCAVLLRVVPPGVALLCAVLFRFAPFGAAARCVVPWGAVRRLGVVCLLAPCFVLSPPAVCVLLWCVAAWCCPPLCFVPCAPWGVVLCVSCRLRPVRCCCVARSPSVPCSPVLCLVVLCCRVVPWCPVLPPC